MMIGGTLRSLLVFVREVVELDVVLIACSHGFCSRYGIYVGIFKWRSKVKTIYFTKIIRIMLLLFRYNVWYLITVQQDISKQYFIAFLTYYLKLTIFYKCI